VFDLVNIIPWLKYVCHSSLSNSLSDLARQHNNTHPITKAPLIPSDLITLHYSRKEASGEIHDPISFKPFSEHSHIVTVATTGNVYLAESVKGGRDLLADISIKKSLFHFPFSNTIRGLSYSGPISLRSRTLMDSHQHLFLIPPARPRLLLLQRTRVQ
jgi:hypothetical protein